VVAAPRTVQVTRYATPLREGGSLPALVEADDCGLYVLKFRGAGQGPKALVAELVAGELARAAGLPVPEIVFVELDPDLARTEPDPEIQDLIRASGGLNVGLDFLPGSVGFDPVTAEVDAELAAAVVCFDALVTNVDRTARNTNLLLWHRRLYLIDHGAALYFHHSWTGALERSRDPFARIRDHVLLPFAGDLAAANERLTASLTPQVVRAVVDLVPDLWIEGEPAFASTDEHRHAYADYLLRRLEPPQPYLEEALRARGERV
jgi:hypothetical protein